MSRTSMLALVVVAVAAVVIGGYLAYDSFLRGDSVAELTLPAASPAAGASDDPTSEPTASANASPATSDEPAASAATGAGGGLAGSWTVASGEAGYRVREQLASLPAESDAVGRTSDVTGSISIVEDGEVVQVTDGSLTVDTTTITSDEGMRDNRMRTQGLQTDEFPTATFTLTEPLDVPAAALAGTPSALTLVGDLTLHGVTRAVEIPAEAQLLDGQIQVAGSTTFALADFDIEAPNVGGFIVSIDDEGALEFLVTFTRS
jgi:polyisoprenoid-binding protein YceI